MTERLSTAQAWYLAQTATVRALLLGMVIGGVGGGLGLLLALANPLWVVAGIIGVLAGVYILTDIRAALYGMVGVAVLLPFATLPVRIGFTPTFLDAVQGVFLLIYSLQWVKRLRTQMYLTPVHALVLLYVLWLIVSFALGLRHAPATSQIIRQFMETVLSSLMVFIIVDFVRDVQMLRRLVQAMALLIAVQAVIGIGLWLLPDSIAERGLLALARIGYPNSGVIRYIESNPELAERAIGTWVDPNTFGGVLAISAAMIAPQLFARRPVLRYRWLTLAVLGLVFVALLLTFSRSSMLGVAAGVGVIALFRGYRGYWLLGGVALVGLLLLPQTRAYVERFGQGLRGEDLATQMRFGEYSDSLRLISRYPIFGVGFTGSPDIDIYTAAASLYLIMANQIGLVGVAIYLLTMLGVLWHGLAAYPKARDHLALEPILLGYHAALVTALVNGVTDLYFFRIDFQGSIFLFWLTVALALASARLAHTLPSPDAEADVSAEADAVAKPVSS
jgi:polysaccharide biosynthesis protein PslJ